MKPISDYDNYRTYIRDFYEERKLMTGLSWRGFNKMAGYASTKFLKLVCDGKSKLSCVGAARLSKVMGLSKIQTSYFLALVTYCNSPVEKKRQAALEQMHTLAKDDRVRVVGGDGYEYFKNWWNPVLRELAPRIANATPSKIANMLHESVTPENVKKSLNFLLQAGFLKERRNRYVQSDKAILGSSEKIPRAIRGMHRQMARLAEGRRGIPRNGAQLFGNDGRRKPGGIRADRKRTGSLPQEDSRNRFCRRGLRQGLQGEPAVVPADQRD